jgi:hypothetical protein
MIPTNLPDTNGKSWMCTVTKTGKATGFIGSFGWWWMLMEKLLVPLAGIEPALLAELDFESSASTNSATGASGRPPKGQRRKAGGI